MKKTRYVPYGYTVRDGKTVVEHEEAKVIRNIFDSYINGDSLKVIADLLTELEIPYTEKSTVWDKARIARIIENPKYMGTAEFAPIIDEEVYENALACKKARNTNTQAYNTEAIRAIRDHIKCGCCGHPMIRRIAARNRIKESWMCSNPECGMRIRIGDATLLEKLTILINRIIENNNLLISKEIADAKINTPATQSLITSIENKLRMPDHSEDEVLDKIRELARERYAYSNASKMNELRLAKNRASMMTPQEEFNVTYFEDLIKYITINELGFVTLHTKTDAEITERTDNA